MSSELKRALLQGATTEIVPKHVAVSGMESMVEKMTQLLSAQVESNLLLAESLNNVVAAIENKELKSTDVSALTEAVLTLRREHEPRMLPVTWVAEFERDARNDSIKSGLRLIPEIPKGVN